MPDRDVPAIEVVIPVHDPTRPFARTLRSLRASGLRPEQLAVTVVAHNIPVSELQDTLADDERDGVDFLSCDDGRDSPAGPRALALARSSARFVSFVDSDDWLEPGALPAWLAVAERTGAAAVIAPERHASGRPVRNPPLRLAGPAALDPRRDRLPYRSALRGLSSVEAIRAKGIAFGSQTGNGSDIAFSLGLWYSGLPVRFASRAPAYVLGDDAADRITRTPRLLAAELAACTELLRGRWFAALPLRDRQLVATKFVRMHLLPGLAARAGTAAPLEAAAEACSDARAVLELAQSTAPGFVRSLSLRDARLVRLLLHPTIDVAAVRELLPLSRVALTALVASRPEDQLRIDAPWRWIAGMLTLPLRMRPPAPRPRSDVSGGRPHP